MCPICNASLLEVLPLTLQTLHCCNQNRAVVPQKAVVVGTRCDLVLREVLQVLRVVLQALRDLLHVL